MITSGQLAAVGIGRNGVAKRVRTGRLHRLHRGVYAVGHNRLSQEATYMAAVLAAGDGAALGNEAAAWHWNVWRRKPSQIDVITPGQKAEFAGIRIHRCRTLDPRDVTRYRGIPITTVPRTLVDLAATLTTAQLANIIHEAAFRNRFNEQAIREAMKRAPGRDPQQPPRRALNAHAAGSAGTRSDLRGPVPRGGHERTAGQREGGGDRSTSTGRNSTSWSRSTARVTSGHEHKPRTRAEIKRCNGRA